MLALVREEAGAVVVRDVEELRSLTRDGTEIVAHIHPRHRERVLAAWWARQDEQTVDRGWLPPAA